MSSKWLIQEESKLPWLWWLWTHSERSSYQKRNTSSIRLRDKTTWPEGETKPWKDNLFMSPPYVACRLNTRKKIFRALMYHFLQFLDLWKKHKLMIQFQGFVYIIGSSEAYSRLCFPRKASVSRELFPDFWFVLTQHSFASVYGNVK